MGKRKKSERRKKMSSIRWDDLKTQNFEALRDEIRRFQGPCAWEPLSKKDLPRAHLIKMALIGMLWKLLKEHPSVQEEYENERKIAVNYGREVGSYDTWFSNNLARFLDRILSEGASDLSLAKASRILDIGLTKGDLCAFIQRVRSPAFQLF
jgi:hypothetical protein